MPEGDNVYLTAKNLNTVLAGRVLVRCDIRVPAFATVDLTGERVDEVISRGKHLLTRIGDHSIHTHLKMDGSWHIYRPGVRWRRPQWQARIVLANAEWETVGFQLGIVEVLPRAAEATVVGHLGPDLLGPDWDAGLALQRLLAAPDAPVGVALLDQSVMAGLGNVYRNELCFLRG
ncbi:MAG TPA: DNA-formamidopyrimidine glycosylase family protein, partial [Terrimesophilobacter sp.]|nr:DNA-formamidopyrimidine glycosylase family protein [Terrimesophilobacter sp.]